ncbi:MAG: porin family protein [Tannerella sp.]|jgi:hypothetical protein|nr:porin family protein [Tannerella sp.]
MNKIISILVLLMFTGVFSLVKAQDVITKKDGNEIRAKVTEVGINEVKYKLFNDQSERLYSLAKSEIFMIVYENGIKDVFGIDSTPAPVQTQTQTQTQGQPPFQTPVATQQTGYRGQSTTPVTAYTPQSSYRKGYVGISFAGSFPTEDSDYASTGTQVNINIGYLFSNHVGIATSILSNTYDTKKYKNGDVGLTGALFGPLFSFGSSPRYIDFDIRPSIGFLFIEGTSNSKWESDDTAFALGLGFSLRWNVSKVISLTANLDYLNQGEFDDTDWLLSSIGSGIGINFRF